MPNPKKRTYNSQARIAQAAATKKRILDAAKKLFQSEGFECVTIEKLAQEAQVSAPTIYALFQSKRGVLRALMDEALPNDEREALVLRFKQEKSVDQRLALSAKIARKIYEAEHAQFDVFRGAALLAPEFKKLEKEREERRYQRQEEGLREMIEEGILAPEITLSRARDILWAFTGRDMYRMMVVERGWPPDEYEKWLAELLVKTLIG